ncbi:MAG TPA: hypothetical protein PKE04_02685, partial [Clostridia bacterium]|nr:hypothetical protein [Clostridia bacterium]
DLDLRVEGAGVRVSLTDRWFNPIDDTVRYFAQHTVEVDRGMMLAKGWTRLRWTWNEGWVQISRGEEVLLT